VKEASGGTRTDSIVFDSLDAAFGDGTELATCAYPEFGVYLVIGYDLALEDMAGEKVVVHRVRDDGCDGRVSKLDKGIVLGSTGLPTSVLLSGFVYFS
jgi:hypothetical protein